MCTAITVTPPETDADRRQLVSVMRVGDRIAEWLCADLVSLLPPSSSDSITS
jgi:hypothetical protein